MMQGDPQPTPQAPPPIINLNLDGLADLIGQWFLGHLPDFGGVVWTGIKDHISEFGDVIWKPLSTWLLAGLHESAEATWNNMFPSISLMFFQMPLALTTNLPAYQAIAMNPGIVAVGGATLALVLLGLRTLFGAMIGADHIITHITARIIPATAMAAGYVVLVGWAIGLINTIGATVGPQALTGMLKFPTPPVAALILPYAGLWVLLIWFALRLMLRLGYGLFRFLLALVFGPVALILWAIPQTEWVTSFWMREFVGWGTSPLLVVVSLAMAIPLAAGQAGFLGAVLFGLAGLQVAHDVVGLLASSRGGGGGLSGLVATARMAASGGGSAVGAAAAMRSYAASERAAATERFYGFD